MISAPHSAAVVAFFHFYSKWKIRRHFHEVVAQPPALDAQRSVLVIGNHFSWWDGFFLLWVNRQHWRRKFHVLMLDSELAKRKLFAKAGAFGIQPGTRDVVNTLRYAAEVLGSPNSMIAVFPQGRIESIYTDQLRFEQGVERIVQMAPSSQVLFAVALPDYGTAQPKPTLRFFFEPYASANFSAEQAEKAFNDFYRRCRAKLTQETEVRHAR
jgi:hypothetical protein